MKVLICDESPFMRRSLQQLLGADAELTVVDVARTGEEALEKAAQHKPDLITLDVELPGLDALTTLRKLRLGSDDPPAVLMCSNLTAEASRKTLQAMRTGAADFFLKQTTPAGIDSIKDELLAKLKAVGHTRRARMGVVRTVRPAMNNAAFWQTMRSGDFDLIAIGGSTGATAVLEKIITALPASLRIPVVVAQHLPAMFTQSLAARLGEQAQVPLRYVTQETPLQAGAVHVIQGGRHGHVRKGAQGLSLTVSDEPQGLHSKPSVDELFLSAARAAGSRCLGIVLSGTGQDGSLGAAQLHAADATLVVQEASTCVVSSMPRSIIDADLAHAVMSPDEISSLLVAVAGGVWSPQKQALPPAA